MKTTFTINLFPSLRTGLLTALLFLLTGGQAYATTYTFSGTGNWNTSARWSPSYPGTSIDSGHDIIIDGSCTVNTTVYSSSPITVNNARTLTIASTRRRMPAQRLRQRQRKNFDHCFHSRNV